MSKRKRREYTEEFKKEAVSLLMSTDKSISEVADNLGIKYYLLSRWKQIYYDKETSKIVKKVDPKDEEIKRLKKENADIKMERDILKKSIAIFSRT